MNSFDKSEVMAFEVSDRMAEKLPGIIQPDLLAALLTKTDPSRHVPSWQATTVVKYALLGSLSVCIKKVSEFLATPLANVNESGLPLALMTCLSKQWLIRFGPPYSRKHLFQDAFLDWLQKAHLAEFGTDGTEFKGKFVV